MSEEVFGLDFSEMPAAVLTSSPGDVNVFDIGAWHAVCGSHIRRRVIEVTYYSVPTTPIATNGFVVQMRANQRQARLAGTPYYPPSWRQAGGPSHQLGLDILASLQLLNAGQASGIS
jgi:hypothetical protein